MSAEPAKPNDIIQILSLLMKYIQNKLTIYYPYFKKHEQFKYGGAMRDRTADLFAASEALSQLSYSPEIFEQFNNWPNSHQIMFSTSGPNTC